MLPTEKVIDDQPQTTMIVTSDPKSGTKQKCSKMQCPKMKIKKKKRRSGKVIVSKNQHKALKVLFKD